jgi:hypothetical protein
MTIGDCRGQGDNTLDSYITLRTANSVDGTSSLLKSEISLLVRSDYVIVSSDGRCQFTVRVLGFGASPHAG